jgi:hypothetical protein
MIREGHKLPEDVIDRIPELIEQIEKDTHVVALYAFRSELISILILSANLTKF